MLFKEITPLICRVTLRHSRKLVQNRISKYLVICLLYHAIYDWESGGKEGTEERDGVEDDSQSVDNISDMVRWNAVGGQSDTFCLLD